MPTITITSGRMSTQKKRELIERLTDTAAEIMGVPKAFYSVTIIENDDENMGVAGETVADLKKRMSKK